MEIKYDKEAGAMYIKLADIPSSFGIVDNTQEITDNVLIDWMKDGTLYGIGITGIESIPHKEIIWRHI